jgi:hypothetical protein
MVRPATAIAGAPGDLPAKRGKIASGNPICHAVVSVSSGAAVRSIGTRRMLPQKGP